MDENPLTMMTNDSNDMLNDSVEWMLEDEKDTRPLSDYIPLLVQLAVVPFVLCGNTVILWAIRKFQSLHIVTYYLLGNLAVADILLAINLAIRCILNLTNRLDKYPCIISNFVTLVSAGGNISGTLIVCLHSYFAVRFPIRFFNGFTTKHAASLLSTAWLFWIVFNVIGVLTGHKEFQVFENSCYPMSGYFSPTFVKCLIFLLQGHLLILVWIQVSTVLLIRTNKAALTSGSFQDDPSTAASLIKLKKTSKIVGMVGLILLFTLIGWVPVTTMALLFYYCESCHITAEQVGLMTAFLLPNMISNVIIYFVKTKEFKRLLPKVCNRSQVNPDTATSPTA